MFICMKNIAYSADLNGMVRSYLNDDTLTPDIKDYMTLVMSYFSPYGKDIQDTYNLLKENSKKLTLK